MTAGRVAVAIVAVVVALIAVGSLVGGTVLTWAYGTQRDADGFLNSPDYSLTGTGYALISDEVDLAARPGDWWPAGLADVRLDAERVDAGAVFVGIGPSDDVDAYLGTVARDEVTHLGFARGDVDLRHLEGSAPIGTPAEQAFWVVSSTGTGRQSVSWEVEPGTWSMVVMNADATPNVAVTFEGAARIAILLGVGIGLLVFGLLLGGLAAALLVWATRGEREAVEAGAVAVPTRYPVTVEGYLDPELSRWMWLVKWFLAIPHMIVLAFLWVAFAILTIVAFFSILFTRRYPKSIFDFNVGVMRWQWRVAFYAFDALGTDRYPPFSLEDADYPARFNVEYPEELSPGLALVKWWLLAIPHYLIVGLFTSGLVWWITDIGEGDRILEVGGGLIGILVFIALIALLFTGRYPRGLFDLVMGLNRWALRVAAYVALMRDEYPPFRLDMGPGEPPVRGPETGEPSGGDAARERDLPVTGAV